jgi:hypothetical protein
MLHSQYKNLELKPFVEKLDNEFYHTIEKLCAVAKKQAIRLSELEVRQATSQYISLCTKLIEEIESYINYRKQELIPYVQELSGKEENGHDCTSCTGNCKMPHSFALSQLKESHTHIKDTLQRLQMAVLPLYSETIYPDAYRVLRNHMALIENNLTELFFFEESFLIPKITEAQKNIHAGS